MSKLIQCFEDYLTLRKGHPENNPERSHLCEDMYNTSQTIYLLCVCLNQNTALRREKLFWSMLAFTQKPLQQEKGNNPQGYYNTLT